MAASTTTALAPETDASIDEILTPSLEDKLRILDAENRLLRKEVQLLRKSLVAQNVQEALQSTGLSAMPLPLDDLLITSDRPIDTLDGNLPSQPESRSFLGNTSQQTYVASPDMVAAAASAAAMAARASVAAALNGGRGGKARKKAAAAEVDLSHYPRRYVALRLMYLGGQYHGFASQPGNMFDMTIESKFFAALEKTRLLPPGGRAQAQYSRCGRTDKGVSALGQVVALWLRSCKKQLPAPSAQAPKQPATPSSVPVGVTVPEDGSESQDNHENAMPAEVSGEAICAELSDFQGGPSQQHVAGRTRGWDVCASVLVNPGLAQSVIEVERDKGEVELSDWSPQGLKAGTGLKQGSERNSCAEEGTGGDPTDWVLLETEPEEEVGQEFPISRERSDDAEWSDGDAEEIDYVAALNRALPEDIRVTGWTPVRPDFDARFSCKYREYKYFFVRGSLDIEAMEKGAALFVGTHDCRNLCRMDTRNVKSFVRTIMDCRIERASSTEGWAGCEMYYIRVRGRAFLWHQVRCMAAILFMVGQGHESPQIVSELLDLRKFPRKPQYQMAPELPLLLHTCGFEDLEFRSTPDAERQVQAHFERLLHGTLFPAGILREALLAFPPQDHCPASARPRTVRGHSHIPLKLRGAEPSHEERLKKLGLTI